MSFGCMVWTFVFTTDQTNNRVNQEQAALFSEQWIDRLLQWWLWFSCWREGAGSKRLSFSLIPHPGLAPLPPFFDSQWRRKLAGGNVDREVAIMRSRASLTILESPIATHCHCATKEDRVKNHQKSKRFHLEIQKISPRIQKISPRKRKDFIEKSKINSRRNPKIFTKKSEKLHRDERAHQKFSNCFSVAFGLLRWVIKVAPIKVFRLNSWVAVA